MSVDVTPHGLPPPFPHATGQGRSGGASDGEYTRQRALENDIAATDDVGPTSAQPGMETNMRGGDEMKDVVPWLSDR